MKFSGEIGFAVTLEVRPDIWQPKMVEKHYKGDILRKSTRWQQGDQANDDLTINHQVSIVANQFAYDHLHEIRYVVFRGHPWKVNSITDERPRLILEIGGVYNGERPKEEP